MVVCVQSMVVSIALITGEESYNDSVSSRLPVELSKEMIRDHQRDRNIFSTFKTELILQD